MAFAVVCLQEYVCFLKVRLFHKYVFFRQNIRDQVQNSKTPRTGALQDRTGTAAR